MHIKRRGKRAGLLLLLLCLLLSAVPTALAAGINYIDSIHVAYTDPGYKAGDAPRATASVTAGHCRVAYEYWREIYQKEAGSVWTGTGRYWYSDPDKMASLAADKRITQFEAGKHYSYTVVLAANRGYFIGKDKTVVSVGQFEWGVPERSTNLEVKEMSTKLYIYSIYSIGLPDSGSTDKVITEVAVTNVNRALDASQPVAFTARPADSCAGQFTVTEEAWEAAGSSNDVIRSTGTSRAPIAGGTYWYSIVLTAKDGYVFSPDFADKSHFIKEGSGVTFTLGGTRYTNQFQVSADGKTLTAWEFMDPVTVKAASSTQKLIREAVITGAKWSYQPGDAPQKAAKLSLSVAAEQYTVAYEAWELRENGRAAAYWYSDSSRYTSGMKRLTRFEEGKTYVYSVLLKGKNGYTFSDSCPVMVNNRAVPAAQVKKTADGLLITEIKTLTPKNAAAQKEIPLVEISGATVRFADGDKPVFTGKAPDGAVYTLVYEAWKTDGAGISSNGSFNDEAHLPLWGGRLITAFAQGSTYTYSLCFKTTAKADADGYVFGPNTRLKINGKAVTFTRDSADGEYDQTFTVTADLTVTPQASAAASTVTSAASAEPDSEPGDSADSVDSAASDEAPKSGGSAVWWIILLVVCAGALTGGILFYKKKHSAGQ